MAPSIPLIDLVGDSPAAIGRACREHGFFYLCGHGVPSDLFGELAALSRRYFALATEDKMQIAMARGGRAWRGYFAVGAEQTRGLPDRKEGLYFGAELPEEDPRVREGRPLHGANLFPDLPGFREVVLEYLAQMTRVGHSVMELIALSLGLSREYFRRHYTDDPLILFRIFHYPAQPPEDQQTWGVGEHTDYGLLTMLKQDDVGGLQIKTRQGWIDAPPIEDALICNLGDMLDRLTGGVYRSTPHRVRNTSGRGRLAFPFFFDPNFDAEIRPLKPELPVEDDWQERWDQASVHAWTGTYGEYLLQKIGRVFPDLADAELRQSDGS